MFYRYNINGQIVRVWRWGDDFHTKLEVHCPVKNKIYERTIRKDKRGEEFFTWNKARVYLKDYLWYSIKELKERIRAGEDVMPDDLCQTIAKEGVANVRFICQLHPLTAILPLTNIGVYDGSKTVEVMCKVVESRYKVMDAYKIGITPLENESVGSEDYYVSDMLSLIKAGTIKIVE